jgi:chromate transporter
VPFPVVVLAAALFGFAVPSAFQGGHGAEKSGPPALLDALLAADPGRPTRLAAEAWRAGWAAILLWLLPVAALVLAGSGVFADIAWFFSKMAVVTVGGAYAVLAYVAQDAVRGYGWLSADQMLVGLGLAETTPGPLILVLQFVGFLAGYGRGGLSWAIPASLLTVWVTFAPCFAFIFLGAPYVERLHANRKLTSAMAAVTAAVVGVIANLAVWFGLRLLFTEMRHLQLGYLVLDLPRLGSLDLHALAMAVLAALCLFRFRLGLLRTLGIAALLGLAVPLVLG